MTQHSARRSVRVVLLLLAAHAVWFTGCKSPSPGIKQLSPDRYRVTVQGHDTSYDTGEPKFKERAITQAMVFAEDQGKAAVPVSIEEHAYGLFGDWVRVEYEFRVVDKNDPRVRRNSTNTAEPKPSVSDELVKLDDLRKKGILTPAEFEREKQKLLAR